MTPPVLENILAQPEALCAVAAYQAGAGREALLRCAGLLRSRKRIVFSGMGASLFAAIPSSYMFVKRGVPAHVVESSELLYFLSPTLDSDTAVVLISRSGESVEVTKLLPLLKARGCPVIGVVNVLESALAREATETIFLNSPQDQSVAVQSYTGTLAALSLLTAVYFDELEIAQCELDRTSNIVRNLLCESLETIDTSDLVNTRYPLYLLGRGPALASVSMGVVILHELAKVPAVGMSSAQFRHGPVEVVTEDFRAIVWASQAATADLDLALAEDLTRLGGKVRWIGPGSRSSSVMPLCTWPSDAPSRFTAILEMIPLQLLAFQMAQRRGLPIGEFRFATVVTRSETGFLSRI